MLLRTFVVGAHEHSVWIVIKYIKLIPKSTDANPVPNAVVNAVVEASGANAPSSSEIAFLSSIKDSSGSPLAIRDKLLLRNSEKFLIKVKAERIDIK